MSFSRGIGRKRTGIGAEMLPVSERRRLACALLRDWACFFAWVASRRSTPVLCDDLLVVTESPAWLLPPGYCYRNPQEVPNFLETNTTYVCGTGPEPVTRKYSNAFLMGIRNSLRLSSSGFAQLVRRWFGSSSPFSICYVATHRPDLRSSPHSSLRPPNLSWECQLGKAYPAPLLMSSLVSTNHRFNSIGAALPSRVRSVCLFYFIDYIIWIILNYIIWMWIFEILAY
jgi:hypothetical protein